MVLRHSAIYMFSRGVPGLIGFATVVVYTRMMSPEGYGQYALVVTTAILVNAILYHWLNGSMLRFLPRCQENPADLLATMLGAFCAVSILAGVGALALILIWPSTQWQQLVLISLALVWAQAWFTLNVELMRSRLMPVKYGLVSSLKAVIALGLGAALVWWQFGAFGAVAGLIIGYLISGLLAARGQWAGVRLGKFDRALIKNVLAYGLPLTASLALNAVINGTDRFMLAGLIDEAATGLYVAGQGLAQQSVGVLMTMINLAAYPLAVRALEQQGMEEAQNQLRKNAFLLLAIGLPSTALFMVLSPEISSLFLGSQFQTAGAELMPWFALGALLSGLRAYYFDLAFYLGRRTSIHVAVMVMAALLNVLLNFALIPRYGLAGAAYASVAAFGIAMLLSAILGRRAFQLPALRGDAAKLLLATLAMAGVLYVLPRGQNVGQMALAVLAGGIVYVASILAMDAGDARATLTRSSGLREFRMKRLTLRGQETEGSLVTQKRRTQH